MKTAQPALEAVPRELEDVGRTLGLAPLIVDEVYRILGELKQTGVAILLVEQNALLALHLADRAYVMDSGRIVHRGPAAELSADRNRIRTLMGLDATG